MKLSAHSESVVPTSALTYGQRLLYVDVAKCVALAFIIVSHTRWSYMVAYIDNMVLPVFWICSGFTSRPGFSLWSKAKKLLFPYLVLSAICLACSLLMFHEDWNNSFLEGFVYSRLKIFPFPLSESNPQLMTMHNSVLWFLTSMFTAFCLFKVLLVMARSFVGQLLIVMILLILQWGLLSLPVLLPWSLDTAPFIASLMCVGHWIGKYHLFEKKYCPIVVLLCAVAFLIFNWLSGPTNYSIREMGEWWPASFLCSVAGATILIYLCRLADDNPFTRLLARLNSQALFIFGLQLVIIALLATVSDRLPQHPIAGMVTTLAINFTIGFLFGKVYTLATRIKI